MKNSTLDIMYEPKIHEKKFQVPTLIQFKDIFNLLFNVQHGCILCSVPYKFSMAVLKLAVGETLKYFLSKDVQKLLKRKDSDAGDRSMVSSWLQLFMASSYVNT